MEEEVEMPTEVAKKWIQEGLKGEEGQGEGEVGEEEEGEDGVEMVPVSTEE